MLELERMFATHDRIHLLLRPDGKWCGDGGPQTIEDWTAVEDYMGLFEHCEILIQTGLLNADMFDRLFGYRLTNILANAVITQAKLVREKQGWTDFLRLVERLHRGVPGLAAKENRAT